MRRVLFVDDEPLVLRAMQAVLRPYRKELDIVFVSDAEAALGELKKGRFDVVVSDMRMPKLDGADLLQQVTQLSPHSLRIILSGYADEDSLVRARAVAHQCLSKPCEVAVLREAINSPLPIGSFD